MTARDELTLLRARWVQRAVESRWVPGADPERLVLAARAEWDREFPRLAAVVAGIPQRVAS